MWKHEYRKCGEEVRPKCCDCGWNHSVVYYHCEVLRREVEVQEISVKGKVQMDDRGKTDEGAPDRKSVV